MIGFASGFAIEIIILVWYVCYRCRRQQPQNQTLNEDATVVFIREQRSQTLTEMIGMTAMSNSIDLAGSLAFTIDSYYKYKDALDNSEDVES